MTTTAGPMTPRPRPFAVLAEPYAGDFGYYESSRDLRGGLDVSVQRLSELPPEIIGELLALQRAARGLAPQTRR